MSQIILNNISHHYTQKKDNIAYRYPVLRDISLTVKSGEFVTLFGPNGSGKSTLFKIVSGLEDPRAGTVTIGGKSPDDVRIGFVFQDYRSSMLPWRDVLGNVALALEARGVSPDMIEKKAQEYLRQVNMESYADKAFYELSGGMSQSVSIARALAFDPELFLLDEPFSALDFQTTINMMTMLLDVWRNNKITTFFISHSIEEAVFLADRVVVLSPRPGEVEEIIPVTLKRPRDPSLLETEAFFALRNKVLDAFNRGLEKQKYHGTGKRTTIA